MEILTNFSFAIFFTCFGTGAVFFSSQMVLGANRKPLGPGPPLPEAKKMPRCCLYPTLTVGVQWIRGLSTYLLLRTMKLQVKGQFLTPLSVPGGQQTARHARSVRGRVNSSIPLKIFCLYKSNTMQLIFISVSVTVSIKYFYNCYLFSPGSSVSCHSVGVASVCEAESLLCPQVLPALSLVTTP